jgi:hypothetical protein
MDSRVEPFHCSESATDPPWESGTVIPVRVPVEVLSPSIPRKNVDVVFIGFASAVSPTITDTF